MLITKINIAVIRFIRKGLNRRAANLDPICPPMKTAPNNGQA